MRRSAVVVCSLAILGGCQTQGRAVRRLAPLAADEGEAYVYLDPLPAEGARLAFGLEAVSAVPAGGGAPLPLELASSEMSGASVARQRLLAWGRLPPGDYVALLLRVKRATLRSDGGQLADLVVPGEPVRVAVPLVVSRGRATVLALSLDPVRAVTPDFRFTPEFVAAIPTTGIVALTGYCTNTGMANVTVFDKHAHRVIAVFPVGGEPRGIALDASRNRAYLAVAGDDEITAIDLPTGTEVGRAVLRGGDRPREVALTLDGRVLIVVNEGSNSVSFVDPSSLSEVDRVTTGEEPRALLLDRSGRRAFVLNRRGSSITVVDIANRAVVTTVPTDPEPVRAQLNRAADRLYIVHAGSAYMTVLAMPGLTPSKRVFVGFGASALKVDPRTDLVYVGKEDEATLQVFDPFSLLPVTGVELPDGASFLAIDDVENALVAVIPGRQSVAFVDLTSRRVVDEVEVGFEPYAATVVGER